VVVVVADGGGEDFLGLVLTDHVAVKVALDVGGLELEFKRLAGVDGGLFELGRGGLRVVASRLFHAGEEHLSAQAALDEFFQLAGDFRGRGLAWAVRVGVSLTWGSWMVGDTTRRGKRLLEVCRFLALP